ncbi:translation initiation factor 4E [Angomonas deanei]|uniref:Eukaryotic initiation factor 4E, putative n=1 Tax=Angomonas deanei TaxID=59799 RepID=S9VLU5_9TRYP|nr:translation initiation factor 4E [Angomonas deanei]EPY41844.1 translation initiation factor 4E [Angomonas deanei]CAD2215445.1 Eukaryotic initiation factor 4E, putative [Angomonas deanei]|eukprot:EPY41403.1 translation initiation factor 4E [Angomonas deanei]
MEGEAALHQLDRNWTLWYDSPSTYNAEDWEKSLVPVITVHSVEEFFAMLRYMKPLHALRTSAQYHFFQEGVKPMWEDEANKKGGKIWMNVEINKNDATDANSSTKTELDKLWENVLMSLIGESLEEEGEENESQIMGVVISKKKYYNRVAVWVRDADNTKAIENITSRLTSGVALPPSVKLGFAKHGEKA